MSSLTAPLSVNPASAAAAYSLFEPIVTARRSRSRTRAPTPALQELELPAPPRSSHLRGSAPSLLEKIEPCPEHVARWANEVNLSEDELEARQLFKADLEPMWVLNEGILKVGGQVVSDDSNLGSLPVLHIAGDLSLECKKLRTLPEGLRVDHDVCLHGCINLTELPASLLEWPSLDEHKRRINVSKTGLSLRQIDSMKDLPHIELIYTSLGLPEEVDVWYAEGQAPRLANWHLGEVYVEAIKQFLNRLRCTVEHENNPTRSCLQSRVQNLLTTMDANPALRIPLSEEMYAANHDCDDKAIWTLNQLDINTKIHAADAMDVKSARVHLQDLAVGLLKLSVVHAHVAQIAAESDSLEDVEIYLAAEIYLRDKIALPVSTSLMRHEGAAYRNLDKTTFRARLDAVGEAAERVARDPAKLARFKKDWAPWQRLLRREAVAETSLQYKNLPKRRSTTEYRENICSLTQKSFVEVIEPVTAYTAEGENTDVFEYEFLKTWWVERGTHPILRTPLDFKSVYRLVPTKKRRLAH